MNSLICSIINNICKRSKVTNVIKFQCRKYAETTSEKVHPYMQVPVVEEVEELTQEEIDRKRNKSRLSDDHFKIMNGKAPADEPQKPENQSLAYQRSLYGLYGDVSGIDPAICFPTKEEIQEFSEYEKVYMNEHIMEVRKKALEKLEEDKLQYRIREEKITKALEGVEAWKKRIREKMEKRLTDAEEAKKKREQLLEEVRRYFGYTIDFKDERFQLMLEQKEKEQKKIQKELRKKKKEEYFMKKLAALEVQAQSDNAASNKDTKKEDNDKNETKKKVEDED